MPWTNYHSHNMYCDGVESPEEFINIAIQLGMPAYGFSSHAPVSFTTDWCIQDKKFDNYLEEVRLIKAKYSSRIQTYLGLEIDYVPGIAGREMHLMKGLALDFFIGSVHFVDGFPDGTPWNIDHTFDFFKRGLEKIFNNDFRKASERFYEITLQMISNDMPNVIGHLDKIKMYNQGNRFFREDDKFYRVQVDKVLDTIKKSGTIVEVNTRGFYRYDQDDFYPSQWIIEKLSKMDIPVMLNSDSHKPEEITAGFEYAAKRLKEAGIKKLWALIDNSWRAYDFNGEGLVL